MRERATLGQGKQVLDLLQQSGISKDRLGGLLNSGILSDLLRADATRLDRPAFRRQAFETRFSVEHGNVALPVAAGGVEAERALFVSNGCSENFSDYKWRDILSRRQKAADPNRPDWWSGPTVECSPPAAVTLFRPGKDVNLLWLQEALTECGWIHAWTWELMRLARHPGLLSLGQYFIGMRYSVCGEIMDDAFLFYDAKNYCLSYGSGSTPNVVWETGLIVVLS